MGGLKGKVPAEGKSASSRSGSASEWDVLFVSKR